MTENLIYQWMQKNSSWSRKPSLRKNDWYRGRTTSEPHGNGLMACTPSGNVLKGGLPIQWNLPPKKKKREMEKPVEVRASLLSRGHHSASLLCYGHHSASLLCVRHYLFPCFVGPWSPTWPRCAHWEPCLREGEMSPQVQKHFWATGPRSYCTIQSQDYEQLKIVWIQLVTVFKLWFLCTSLSSFCCIYIMSCFVLLMFMLMVLVFTLIVLLVILFNKFCICICCEYIILVFAT